VETEKRGLRRRGCKNGQCSWEWSALRYFDLVKPSKQSLENRLEKERDKVSAGNKITEYTGKKRTGGINFIRRERGTKARGRTCRDGSFTLPGTNSKLLRWIRWAKKGNLLKRDQKGRTTVTSWEKPASEEPANTDGSVKESSETLSGTKGVHTWFFHTTTPE